MRRRSALAAALVLAGPAGAQTPPVRLRIGFAVGYAPFSEVGTVGSSCLNADGPNDQHFMEDHLAMIQASRPVPGFSIEVPAFC